MKKSLLWGGCFTALWLLMTPAQAVDLQNMTKEQYDEINKIRRESNIPLIVAAKKGDLDEVKKLLAEGADVNVKDIAENTPLLAAAENNNTELLKILLDAGAEVNVRNTYLSYMQSGEMIKFSDRGKSPLFLAVARGNVEAVKLLLDKGAEVNTVYGESHRRSEITALMQATLIKSAEIVKLLIEHGADVHYKDDGDDNLICTTFEDLDKMVDVSSEDNKFAFLLDYIEERQKSGGQELSEEEMMQFMAQFDEKKAQNSAKEKAQQKLQEAEDILIMLLKAGVNIEEEMGRLKETPLAYMAWFGEVNAVRLLLKHGANANSRDGDGRTPLMHVASMVHDERGPQIVKMLLEHGAAVNAQDNAGATALMIAAENAEEHNHCLEVMKLLLDAGADMNIVAENLNGGTALHTAFSFASQINEYDAPSDLLLSRGANINIQDKNGWTVLMDMVNEQDLRIVKKLLEKGADVNVKTNEGFTALMEAAYHDNPELTQILLDYGADINAQTKYGQETAISIATEKGNDDVVEVLLAGKRNPVKGGRSSNAVVNGNVVLSRETLIAAIKNNNVEMVRQLLEKGVKVDVEHGDYDVTPTVFSYAEKINNPEMFALLKQYGVDANQTDEQGFTALMEAAGQNNMERVKKLLDMGADVNIKTTGLWGGTAIMNAVKNGNKEMVQLLLRHGANINLKDSYQCNALFYAVGGSGTWVGREHQGNPEMVKFLLENGANVNDVNWFGETIFDCAEAQGNQEIIKLLEMYRSKNSAISGRVRTRSSTETKSWDSLLGDIKTDVDIKNAQVTDVNQADEQGFTILMDASSKNDVEQARQLLEKGADANLKATGLWGETALMYAVQNGNAEMVRLLLKHGAKVNIKDNYDCNALFYAVGGSDTMLGKDHFPNPEMVELLLENGVNVNEVNWFGKTILDCAKAQGNDEVIELLETYGAKSSSMIGKREKIVLKVEPEMQGITSPNLASSEEEKFCLEYVQRMKDLVQAPGFFEQSDKSIIMQTVSIFSEIRANPDILDRNGGNYKRDDGKGFVEIRYPNGAKCYIEYYQNQVVTYDFSL